ncbi:MAG TPA: hypothetical protein VII49_00125 [Rhizomicrobium sp.]
MALYRFYMLDAANHIIQARNDDCLDDAEACAKAQDLSIEFAVEVWCGDRRVCHVRRGGGKPDPVDRLAG